MKVVSKLSLKLSINKYYKVTYYRTFLKKIISSTFVTKMTIKYYQKSINFVLLSYP